MPRSICRKRPLSLGQRMLCDYLHFSGKGQTAAAERLMQLSDVAAARLQAQPQPSWAAIMTKAFALAARNQAEMRSAYFSFPWGHIGEFDRQIASVVMSRQIGDEDVIVLAPLSSPEDQTLAALNARLRRYKEEPVESINPFRRALRILRLPSLIRWFLWWVGVNAWPRQRSAFFGTFGVTTMSAFGARTLEVPSLWAALLHYGTMTATGEIPVGVAFDHRIVAGATVGYTLLEMEQIMHGEILAELRTMRRVQAA
jgi:hypothetical protein